MPINDLIKSRSQRGTAPGTTIRLPADLRDRLQRANARLEACGYKPVSLQQLAVAALEEACQQLEQKTARGGGK